MGIGSFASLRDLGFPIGLPGTELVLKPDAQMPDEAFKRMQGPALERVGKVVAIFDNEPGNCNVLGQHFPDAHSVLLDTQHLPGAPPLDFVLTVCDNAAGEVCPVWPGQPMTAHWGIPDPAAATGSPAEIALAFKDAYRMLHGRIGVFMALPLRSLDQLSLQSKLRDIARLPGATAKAAEPN